MTVWNTLLLVTMLGALIAHGYALHYATRPGAATSPRLTWLSLTLLLVNFAGGCAWIGLFSSALKEGSFSIGPLGFLLALPAFGETFRFDVLLDPKVKHLTMLPRTQMAVANSSLSFLLGCALWDILRRSLHLATPGPLILLATVLGIALLIGNARVLPRLLNYPTKHEQNAARHAAMRMATIRANLLFACYGLVYLTAFLPFASLPELVREIAGAFLFTTFWLGTTFPQRLWDAKIVGTLGAETIQATGVLAPQPLPATPAKSAALTLSPTTEASPDNTVRAGTYRS